MRVDELPADIMTEIAKHIDTKKIGDLRCAW
jgi:hypothetical protein